MYMRYPKLPPRISMATDPKLLIRTARWEIAGGINAVGVAMIGVAECARDRVKASSKYGPVRPIAIVAIARRRYGNSIMRGAS